MCIFVKILFLYWVLLNIPERIGKIKFSSKTRSAGRPGYYSKCFIVTSRHQVIYYICCRATFSAVVPYQIMFLCTKIWNFIADSNYSIDIMFTLSVTYILQNMPLYCRPCQAATHSHRDTLHSIQRWSQKCLYSKINHYKAVHKAPHRS